MTATCHFSSHKYRGRQLPLSSLFSHPTWHLKTTTLHLTTLLSPQRKVFQSTLNLQLQLPTRSDLLPHSCYHVTSDSRLLVLTSSLTLLETLLCRIKRLEVALLLTDQLQLLLSQSSHTHLTLFFQALWLPAISPRRFHLSILLNSLPTVFYLIISVIASS